VLILPSRATRKGTPGHVQTTGTVVVVELVVDVEVVDVVVVLCFVLGVVVLVLVVVVAGPQPCTRKSMSSRWSVAELPVTISTR
jgi:hypothetical protein